MIRDAPFLQPPRGTSCGPPALRQEICSLTLRLSRPFMKDSGDKHGPQTPANQHTTAPPPPQQHRSGERVVGQEGERRTISERGKDRVMFVEGLCSKPQGRSSRSRRSSTHPASWATYICRWPRLGDLLHANEGGKTKSYTR